ncbi:MAG: RNA methyltransferase [Chitinophagaceae bacterium]|nr:RNA methyltransferase [Chitinophagaceae bacterium]
MLSKSRVKYIQSLYHKKFRDEANKYVIEGPKVLAEFLRETPHHIQEIYCIKTWFNNNRHLLSAISPDIIFVIEDHELARISSLSTPNQVLAVIIKNASKEVSPAGRLSLMLDNIQDPGNLGTIIRIADWFGIKTIFCSEDCVDMYNPKVIQSTMGSILRVNTVYADLEQVCRAHAEIRVYGATLNGQSLFTVPPPVTGILLIGNESKGIRQQLLSFCTSRITIPRLGNAESLNAAVATGIILSHFTQQPG